MVTCMVEDEREDRREGAADRVCDPVGSPEGNEGARVPLEPPSPDGIAGEAAAIAGDHARPPGPGAARDNLRDIDAALYEELRGIAARFIRKEGASSRQAGPSTTSLVNDVWLRLARSGRDVAHDRQHLLALASIVARRTLVDAAKARLATRRGGGARPESLVSDTADASTDPAEIVAVDELLTRLAKRYPRAARALEMRVFGGFPVETIAEVLGISPTSVKRDLDFARRWIAQELGDERGEERGEERGKGRGMERDADPARRPTPRDATRPDIPGDGA